MSRKNLNLEKSSFSKLPEENILEIFQNLNLNDLLTISRVNRCWNRLSEDHLLWKNQLTIFGFNQTISNAKSAAKSIIHNKIFNIELLSSNGNKKVQFTNFCREEGTPRTFGMDFAVFNLNGIKLKVWHGVGKERAYFLYSGTDFLLYFPDNVQDLKDWIKKIDDPSTYQYSKDFQLKKSWCLIEKNIPDAESIEKIAKDKNIECIYTQHSLKKERSDEQRHEITKQCLTQVVDYINVTKKKLLDALSPKQVEPKNKCNVM